MATLTQVQMAFKQGDKSTAAQLLKTVLREQPSADAWVMAARLTSNPETAKLHLQRALAFNPKHVKARDMLRDLGGTPMSTTSAFTNGLIPSLRSELEKFGANKPILRDFSPKMRMITAISLYGVVGTFMLVAISSLVNPAPPAPPPVITPISVFQGDTLVSQWTTAGLNLSEVEHVAPTATDLWNEELTFSLSDEAGQHAITVFLYKDLANIVGDGAHLTPFTSDGKFKMDFLQTAVIIYPADLSEAAYGLLANSLAGQPNTST